MHGGIGMTDEHEIGFFMKRARASLRRRSVTRHSTATATPR